MDFSDEQLDFIGAPTDKDTLVIAPPGSGKSAVTQARVAYMILNDVPADRILVTMFNKPAAKEFRESYAQLNIDATPIIRHYHSIAYRLCQNFMDRGVLPRWKLENKDFIFRKMAKAALQKAVSEYGSSNIDLFDPEVLDSFVSFIDFCKSDIQPSSIMFSRLGLSGHLDPFKLGFDLYEEKRALAELRDFNDLLYDVVQVLKRDERCRKILANKLDQIIIDEYQDINPIVQELITVMAGSRAKVTGIGDDDQTIFEWRGSNPLVMSRQWDNQFPDSQKFKLSSTYRYGHALALAANNCIFNNNHRSEKMCLSTNDTPATKITIGYYATPSFGAEPYTDTKQVSMVEAIHSYMKEGNTYKDIAILPRLYSVTPFIELALFRAGIPYKLASGKSIYTQPIFSALEAMAQLCRDGGDSSPQGTLFTKVMMTPNPGVKASLLPQLFALFQQSKVPTLEDVQKLLPDAKPYSVKRVSAKLEAIRIAIQKLTPAEAFNSYIENYLLNELENSMRNASSRTMSHAMALANGFFDLACQSNNYDSLIATIEQLKASEAKDADAIPIMSMHMAKGLTVGMAIIPACCESITPAIVPGKITDINAERRLFYVGITRPRERLMLMLPNDEAYKRAYELEYNRPPEGHLEEATHTSRFVYEMNIKGSMRVADAIIPEACGSLKTSSTSGNFNRYLSNLHLFMRVDRNV